VGFFLLRRFYFLSFLLLSPINATAPPPEVFNSSCRSIFLDALLLMGPGVSNMSYVLLSVGAPLFMGRRFLFLLGLRDFFGVSRRTFGGFFLYTSCFLRKRFLDSWLAKFLGVSLPFKRVSVASGLFSSFFLYRGPLGAKFQLRGFLPIRVFLIVEVEVSLFPLMFCFSFR